MHDPTASSSLKRIDLSSIRLQLQTVLAGSSSSAKDNFTSYWEQLRKYVQAKLSKKELEHFVRNLLGDEHLYLHNLFIQAILTNARSPHLPDLPPHPPSYPRPEKKKHHHHHKASSLTHSSTSSATTPYANSKKPLSANNNIKKKVPVSLSSGSVGGLKGSGHLQRGSDKSGTVKKPGGTKKTSGLPLLGPEYNVLRARLQKIATEAGLSGITQDAIQFMMVATETYVKQIMQNTKTVPRPQNQLLLQLQQQQQQPQQQQILSINDLYRTTILHPSLLSEDFLLHQEHLSLALM